MDSMGNAIVTGVTEDDSVHGGTYTFPTTPGAYDTSHNGWYDVFVVKLNSNVQQFYILLL